MRRESRANDAALRPVAIAQRALPAAGGRTADLRARLRAARRQPQARRVSAVANRAIRWQQRWDYNRRRYVVRMDTASGSIRDSEPTSPTSPTSPASPTGAASAPAHPHVLHQALYSLHQGEAPKSMWPATAHFGDGWPRSGRKYRNCTGTPNPERGRLSPASSWSAAACWGAAGLVDSEALIAVELCLVKGEGDSEDLRIANILFNNLDIIGESHARLVHTG